MDRHFNARTLRVPNKSTAETTTKASYFPRTRHRSSQELISYSAPVYVLKACPDGPTGFACAIPKRNLFFYHVTAAIFFLFSLLSLHPARATVTPSGAFITDVPIEVPAFHGLEPNLRLVYSSQSGNGWLGVGWGLQGLSEIKRTSPGKGLPHGDAEDIYVLDGMELIPCAGAATGTPVANSPSCKYPADKALVSYTTRIESFLRIAFQPSAEGGTWIVWDKLGKKRIYTPHLSEIPYWHLSQVEDTLGHIVFYHYSKDDGNGSLPVANQTNSLTKPPPDQEYLDEIRYNGSSIRFYSELRPDIITSATGSELITTNRRLRSIAVSVGGVPARAYALTYDLSPATNQSKLIEIRQYGTDVVVDDAGAVNKGTALPPIKFKYPAIPEHDWLGGTPVQIGGSPTWDGMAPKRVFSGETKTFNIPKDSIFDYQYLLNTSFVSGDFDGDGRSDALVNIITDAGENTVIKFLLQFADQRKIESELPFKRFPCPSGRYATNPAGQIVRLDDRCDEIQAWPADINGDNKSDLILMSWEQADPDHERPEFGRVYLTLNTAISQGNGSFRYGGSVFQRTPWLTNSVSGPTGPVCKPGDLNGDNRTDFVCVFQSYDNTSHSGQETGQAEQNMGIAISRAGGGFDIKPLIFITSELFALSKELPSETRAMAIGDTNADGFDDIQIVDYRQSDKDACPIGQRATCEIHYDLLTKISEGDGTFLSENPWPTDWKRIEGVQGPMELGLMAADLNGDGRSDYLAIAGSDSPDQFVSEIRTAIRQPGPSYNIHSQPVPSVISDKNNRIVFGDINGDRAADLLVASPTGLSSSEKGCVPSPDSPQQNLIKIISNNDGTFNIDDCHNSEVLELPLARAFSFSNNTQAPDINGDGLADFVHVSDEKSDPDHGVIRFSLYDKVSVPTGLDTHHWFMGDISGDGRDDLIYIFNQANSTQIHSAIRQADGSYNHVIFPLPLFRNPALASWKVIDKNGDGKLDLVHIQSFRPQLIGMTGVEIDSFISNGDGTWLHSSPERFPTIDFAPHEAAGWKPMDINRDGKVDLVYLWSSPDIEGLLIDTLVSDDGASWIQKETKGPFKKLKGEDTRNWFSADVDSDRQSDLVYVESSRGAISVTSLLARGDADWQLRDFAQRFLSANDGFADIKAPGPLSWRPMQANEDGAADLVFIAPIRSGGVRVHTLFSSGDGWGWTHVSRDARGGSDLSPESLAANDWHRGDANADGRTDLLQIYRDASGVRIDTLVSLGSGKWDLRSEPLPDPGDVGNRFAKSWSVGDMDGDDKSDMVRVDLSPDSSPPSLSVSSLISNTPNNLLSQVFNGLGGITSIQYKPSSHFQSVNPSVNCGLPVGLILQVTSVIGLEDSTIPIEDSEIFSYACPHWSYQEPGFLGWERVFTTRSAAENRPQSTATSHYKLTEQCGAQSWLQESRVSDQNLYSQTFLAYEPSGTVPPYKCRPTSASALASNQGQTYQETSTRYSYDDFGNLTEVFESGDKLSYQDDRRTVTTYHPAIGPYIVGLPASEIISDHTSSGDQWRLARSTAFCYDGDNTPACSAEPSKGLPTAVKREAGPGLESVKTTFEYDDNNSGNIKTITDARGFQQAVEYDSTYHIFPVKFCNALGHCIRTEWDPVIGQIKKITDPNGAITHFDYDLLARLTTITYPKTSILNQTVAHREYPDDQDFGNPKKQKIRDWIADGTEDGLWTDTYFDGFGRSYYVVKKGDSPERNFALRTIFSDASPRVYKQSDWFVQGAESPFYEKFEYDGWRRPVKQRHADDTHISFRYGNDSSQSSITVYDELGHPKTIFNDALGRISQVEEKNGENDITTSYRYNGLDEVLTVTDNAGNVITNTWDLLGRRISMNDPDMGAWRYQYDPAGNLISQTDARGTILRFAYDPLNRITTKEYPNDQKIVWNYDEPNHGASIGRLTSISDPSAEGCPAYLSEDMQYDAVGQTTYVMKCIKGKSFTTTYTHDDPLGRLTTIGYPDGEKVQYSYGPAGRLQSMPGYVNQLRYDPAGRLTRIEHANGIFERFEYDPKSKLLTKQTIARGQVLLHDESRQFRPDGMIRSMSSASDKTNLSFEYDDLRRLTNITGGYNQHFEYDTLGNMTYNSDVGTYSYQGLGPVTGCGDTGSFTPCPHAVKRAGTKSFIYDANGNMTQSFAFGSKRNHNKTIEWNFDNLPEVIDDNKNGKTRLLYDASGERVYKSLGIFEGQTRYYGPLFELRGRSGLFKDLVKNYYAGPMLVARKDKAGTYWYHSDHLSSTRMMTDRKAVPVNRYNYKAFGAIANSSEKARNDIKFTGHRLDGESDLIYMNARYYDPSIGRFISADPTIPDSFSREGFNRYSYVFNNPIRFSDSSGYQPDNLWIEVNEQATWDYYSDPEVFARLDQEAYQRDLAGAPAVGTLNYITHSILDVVTFPMKWGSPEGRERVKPLYDAFTYQLGTRKGQELSEGWKSMLELTDATFSGYALGRSGVNWARRVLSRSSAVVEGVQAANASVASVEQGILAARLAQRGKVIYGSTDLSKAAQVLRRSSDFKTGNVAVFEYIQDGEKSIIAMSNVHASPSSKGKFLLGSHSERNIGNDLLRQGVDPSRVTRVYTELPPCINGSGGCSVYLKSTFPNADITWSFDSHKELLETVRALFGGN